MFLPKVAITHMRVRRSSRYFSDCVLYGSPMRHATRNAKKMNGRIRPFSRANNLSPQFQVSGARVGRLFYPVAIDPRGARYIRIYRRDFYILRNSGSWFFRRMRGLGFAQVYSELAVILFPT